MEFLVASVAMKNLLLGFGGIKINFDDREFFKVFQDLFASGDHRNLVFFLVKL